jgi:tetratricopeptide (TPR) repeat protein
MYGQEGNDEWQLALYQVAHEAGWLTRSNELVQMAQLLLQADVPVQAAKIIQAGLDDGTIESNERNWRLLAQSWQLAQDDPQAVPALTRAAGLAEDGTLDVSLAQSYQNLYEWESCVDAAREGIRKGDLRREDQAYMILGACLFEQKEYTAARNAFEEAAEDERSRGNARSWIQYVDSEQARDEELAAALAR